MYNRPIFDLSSLYGHKRLIFPPRLASPRVIWVYRYRLEHEIANNETFSQADHSYLKCPERSEGRVPPLLVRLGHGWGAYPVHGFGSIAEGLSGHDQSLGLNPPPKKKSKWTFLVGSCNSIPQPIAIVAIGLSRKFILLPVFYLISLSYYMYVWW